ncbi:uncharacterized protein [Apostichopus japonicus]|uniref:uncharacterized protein isoform X1 n=1 Tax=Stichopus japonicus TaxID=307972 RepID=UPI003AB34B22
MDVRLFFIFVIGYVSLAATKNTNDNEISENLEKDSQLKDLLDKLQQFEEWKDTISKEVDNLKKIFLNYDKSSPKSGSRKRRETTNANKDTAHLPSEGCTPGTLGCPLLVTPFSATSSCILCPGGPRGYPGPAGPPGRDGRDAIALISSSDNTNTGSTVHTNAHYDANPPSNVSGAIYVRWGHHECPPSSKLIYSGTGAAPTHQVGGGGVDQLCLPGNPVYDSPIAGVGGARAFLYGLEYQIDSFGEFNIKAWHDVPCAVCLATTRFAKLMVPGTNVCPNEDWTLEYGGYLMAERTHEAHKRSLHICVDRELQVLDRTSGGASNNKKALLDLVESRCSSSGGGIPCGPYVDAYEMTCAVCTL